MKRILRYLNPIAHLGEKNYSVLFPLLTTVLAAAILEFLAYYVFHDPLSVSLAAIFVFIGLIVYFSFREGIRAGFIAAFITICYYFYIIKTRNYQGQQLSSGLETTAVLGALYFLIAWIIGWLKQTIDTLIEQEANEKIRFRSILQQLPVGVVVVDQNGKFLLGNKQIETIIGRKLRTDGVIGRDTASNAFYNNKPVSATQWPIAQSFTTGKTISGKEFVFEHADGKRKHVQISASTVHNREGKVIAVASIFNDITPHKELEERKDDFVNMASHELKTPITSIKLYVDMLMQRLKKSSDKDTVRIMKGMHDQTEKLQGLVNDLLDVSRLQTGKMMFTYEEFRLDQLITETVEGLKRTTRKQKLVFDKKVPISVKADRFRIYQVITNLITNASKYSPEGTTISIRLKKERDSVVVSVSDQGIGIPEDQQKKIFGRLYQVARRNEKSPSGLGMGLYIVHEIIKRHHGSIWVESKEGKGSTFYFSLPLAKSRKA